MHLFPVLKANIDAVRTINALLTVAVAYPWFPVLFQRAQLTSPFLVRIFWGDTRMGWKRSLNRRVVLSCYSCKWLCLCNKQSTTAIILALQRSLKFHPHCTLVKKLSLVIFLPLFFFSRFIVSSNCQIYDSRRKLETQR